MNILSTFGQTSDLYITNTSYTAPTADEMATYLTILAWVALGFYIFAAICLMRIFKKAGVAPWAAWVPVYNMWKFYEIGNQKGYWAILYFIPVINIVSLVFYYVAMFNIGKKLDKGGGFLVLGIFLPFIWLIWLAFDSSVWGGELPAVAADLAPIDMAAPVVETPVMSEPTLDAPVSEPTPEVSVEAPAPSEEAAPQDEQTPPTPPTM